jgi:hypothetical protein
MDRYEISKYLDGHVIGFYEGSDSGIRQSVVRSLNKKGLPITVENVRIVIDELDNPRRHCMSIHVDYNNEHYESIIRNLLYDTGCED